MMTTIASLKTDQQHWRNTHPKYVCIFAGNHKYKPYESEKSSFSISAIILKSFEVSAQCHSTVQHKIG
jgi:hypothetical protein